MISFITNFYPMLHPIFNKIILDPIFYPLLHPIFYFISNSTKFYIPFVHFINCENAHGNSCFYTGKGIKYILYKFTLYANKQIICDLL